MLNLKNYYQNIRNKLTYLVYVQSLPVINLCLFLNMAGTSVLASHSESVNFFSSDDINSSGDINTTHPLSEEFFVRQEKSTKSRKVACSVDNLSDFELSSQASTPNNTIKLVTSAKHRKQSREFKLVALEEPNETVWVLSIDGGGMKGLGVSMLLAEMEKRYKKPISHIFDLMVGPSTAGLIIAGLNVPLTDDNGNILYDASGKGIPKYSAEDIKNFYINQGPIIFQRKNWLSFNGALRPKYSAKGLKQVTKELLGNVRISECITNVLITAVDIERNEPIIFSKDAALQDHDANFFLYDVTRASASPPTYFKPYQFTGPNGTYYSCVDGGLIGNNLSNFALNIAAYKLFPKAKQIKVVSLGTGHIIQNLSYKRMKHMGAVGWIRPLIDIMMGCSSKFVHIELDQSLQPKKIAPGIYRRYYYRFDLRLNLKSNSLDNVSQSNIKRLIHAGERLIRDNSDEIDEIGSYIIPNYSRSNSVVINLFTQQVIKE